MECNSGNTEDRKSEDDEMLRRVWKAVRAKVEKTRVAKAKRGREKERERKERRN